MKRKLKNSTIILSFFLLAACSTEENFTEDKNTQELSHASQKDEKSTLKETFAISLMKSLNESPRLRDLLKNETLKMFNKDYEVLIYSIKDNILENGMTLEELINKNSEADFKLFTLLQI